MLHLIHTPATMTVRQYARYEADRNPRLLFRRFAWLPVQWFDKQIEKFTEDFNAMFSPAESGELHRQVEKLIYQNRLIRMQAWAEAIHVHLVHKAQLDYQCSKLGIKREPDVKLAEYIEQIYTYTGQKIETLQDVEAFMDEIERLVDKYGEMFPEKAPVKSATIMELFYVYCSILEVNPQYTDMLLVEFADLKKQAEERSRKMQEQIKKKQYG